MTDKLTLNDLCLRYETRTVDPDADPAYEANVTIHSRHRPLTEAELVSVLESMGAKRVEASEIHDQEGRLFAHPGSYLVLPLPDQEAEQ